MVAERRHEDLGLVLEPAEGLAVDDAVAVALKGRPQGAVGLRASATGGVGASGRGAEHGPLELGDALREALRNGPGWSGDAHIRIVPATLVGTVAAAQRRPCAEPP